MLGYKVFAPATLSNLSVGFDLLGLAINDLGDEVIAREGKEKGLKIHKIHGASGQLSRNINENTASYAAYKFLKDMGLSDKPIELEIYKKMGIGTGLGSSAASAVAGVLAVNYLIGSPKTKRELIPYALEAERMVHESCPADNVAASMLGGLVLSSTHTNLRTTKIFTPPGLYFVIIHPDSPISTAASRSKLPTHISLDDHIQQSSELAFFIASMHRGDFEAIQVCLKDHIIEKHRKNSIPLFEQVRKISIDLNSLGHGISGSGPSMFVVCQNSLVAENVKDSVSQLYKDSKISSYVEISQINNNGAVLC